jgi:lipopolysaccharide export LptBFGC system permease protein LptF
MGNGMIAFLFAVGFSAWVFNKFYKRSGGNTKTSLSAAALVGVIAFLIFLTILWQVT